jgi:hypothetical protein
MENRMVSEGPAEIDRGEVFRAHLWSLFGWRNRLRVGAGIVLSFLRFWWAGATFGIPIHRDLPASLTLLPWSILYFLLIVVLLVVSVLIGTLLAGSFRFDAGLLAACWGMAALSMRGAGMGDLLRGAASPAVFLQLALELLVLFAAVGAAWAVLWLLHRRGFLQPDALRDGVADAVETPAQKVSALAAAVLGMLVAMAFFCQTDNKTQVMVAVALSAFLGTLLAHWLFPVHHSVWYWTAPLVLGFLGYILAYFSPAGWEIGHVRGQFAFLTHPLPLDYATAGVGGAIVGYWMSRRWYNARQTAADA